MKDQLQIKIVHDYVQITENGKSIQIAIKDLVDVILPILNKHEYTQPKHFTMPNGKLNYQWDDSNILIHDCTYIKRDDPSSKCVYLRENGDSEYEKVSYGFYAKRLK